MPGGSASVPPVRWPVIITEWALDSYLGLKHLRVFDVQEYCTQLRPDVELLRDGIPSPHAKFQNSKFWGPATLNSVPMQGGHKMKWHNFGRQLVQLRLPVAIGNQTSFLCAAYVKTNPAFERRQLARFKTHMNLIAQGQFFYRGTL